MSIPRSVQRWLSYFLPLRIEQVESETNPHLEICYDKGEYKLLTDNCVYSFGTRYTSLQQSFKKLDLAHRPVQKVLSLGFGLGSVYPLLQQYKEDFTITGVEKDPKIIELVQRYFTAEALEKIDLIHSDAFDFIKQCNKKFDLIVMDIFLDNKIPQKFETEEFLNQIKSLINNKGLFLYNRLDNEETSAFYENTFLTIFPTAYKLKANGNYVLIYDSDQQNS